MSKAFVGMVIVRVKFDRLDVPLILHWSSNPVLLMAQMLVNCIRDCYSGFGFGFGFKSCSCIYAVSNCNTYI